MTTMGPDHLTTLIRLTTGGISCRDRKVNTGTRTTLTQLCNSTHHGNDRCDEHGTPDTAWVGETGPPTQARWWVAGDPSFSVGGTRR